MYTCKTCKKNSKSKNEYLSHVESHSTTSKKFYPCCFCSITFKNKKSFYDHIEIHEKNEPKEEKTEILCKHCKLMFSSVKGQLPSNGIFSHILVSSNQTNEFVRTSAKVSNQGVKSIGGHFACLCRGLEFYEVIFFLLLCFKKKMEIILHFLSFL